MADPGQESLVPLPTEQGLQRQNGIVLVGHPQHADAKDRCLSADSTPGVEVGGGVPLEGWRGWMSHVQ